MEEHVSTYFFMWYLCSFPTAPECVPVLCMEERTSASRLEIWREAATCWWPHLEDWWT